MSQSGTAELAAFLADRSELPDRLFVLARRYTLDTLGVAAFGSGQPWSRIAAEQGRRTCPNGGPSTVLGHAWTATPAVAAFVNGCAGHAFELDDVHDETIMHPGTVVIPAALAVAEAQGSSVGAFLRAVIMGYEAAARAGLAVNPKVHMLRGFHPTGTMGVFGSAAAAGVLLDLDASQMRSALGIAASCAGGLMEFSQSGGMVKRIHGGRAAEGGVQAAYLAMDGLEGPGQGLDGRFGFCNTFSDAPVLELLTQELGSRFMIDEITVKPYACCSDVHPIIDALLEIRGGHEFHIDDIEAIEVQGPTKVAEQNALDGTTSIMAAQYSAPFTAAATLLMDIRDPGIYNPSSLTDPKLRALQAKVRVHQDDEFDREYAWKIGARVKVRLVDGRVLESTVNGALGSIHQPLDQSQVEEKFRLLADHLYASDQLDVIVDAVSRLDVGQPASELSALLRA